MKLQDLQLPGDNPAGGIDFLATTGLSNPRYGHSLAYTDSFLTDSDSVLSSSRSALSCSTSHTKIFSWELEPVTTPSSYAFLIHSAKFSGLNMFHSHRMRIISLSVVISSAIPMRQSLLLFRSCSRTTSMETLHP